MKKLLKDKLKSLEKLDVIKVEWVDAEKDEGEGWTDIEQAILGKQKYVTASTVGFFISYNKELLRCTSDYDRSNDKIYGTNDIQLSNIKSITRLIKHEEHQ
jgi:hypothetical protein